MCPEGYRTTAPDFTSVGIKSNHFISPHNNSAVNSVSPSAVSSNRNVCVCTFTKRKNIVRISFMEILSVRFLFLAPFEFFPAVISHFLQSSVIGLTQ